MSYSLEFCKARASMPNISHYFDRNWNDAIECSSVDFFDKALFGVRKWTIEGKDQVSSPITLNLELKVEPDAKFEYFTSASSIHDGTIMFVRELIDECIMHVVTGSTHSKNIRPPQDGDTILYTVGNLVILNEFDESGTKFAPVEKPYLTERTTVALPIKMKILRRG